MIRFLTAGLIAVVLATDLYALEPVTDLSPVRLDRVEFQWQPVSTRRDQTDEFHMMIAQVGPLEFQLDLQKYLRKPVKLYFVVPYDGKSLSTPDALQISWPNQGKLVSGQGISDQRILVYQGVVDEAFWRQQLYLRLKVDSRRFNPPLNSLPRFEIELIR